MTKTELNQFIIEESTPIVDCLEKLDLTAKGILFVKDKEGKLSGCMTDGDIRRWILKTGELAGIAKQFMHPNPIYAYNNNIEHLSSMLNGHRVDTIPIVDECKRIVDIKFDVNNSSKVTLYNSNELSNTDVVIMAGGKGTRLFPYTKILPKPLIPIGDIPIIERIMDKFYQYGTKKFFLTVNYKKDMIKAYFSESNKEYDIEFVDEEIPLGTAGSIRLIDKKMNAPFFLTNCDILIEAEYNKILDYHIQSGNDMTIVASLKNTVIQYGVLHAKEQGLIMSMDEKPVISNFINTGMYVINPEFISWIPENCVYHMPQLAQKLIERGKRVAMYPISENSFLDMGQFEEMRKMEERILAGEPK